MSRRIEKIKNRHALILRDGGKRGSFKALYTSQQATMLISIPGWSQVMQVPCAQGSIPDDGRVNPNLDSFPIHLGLVLPIRSVSDAQPPAVLVTRIGESYVVQ
jgi:hypothetical protein